NFPGRQFTDSRVVEFDGDRISDIAITYTFGDTAWLEVIDPDEGQVYRRAIAAGSDLDRDGSWDGEAFLVGGHDLNGDGHAELLIKIFTGFDHSPRHLSALDLFRDSVLWTYAVAGDISGDYVQVVEPDTGRAPVIVMGVAPVSNGVSAGGMSDSVSYLVCLDADGRPQWSRVIGGKGTSGGRPIVLDSRPGQQPRIAFVEVDGDRSFRTGPGALDTLQERLLVCDLNGLTQDTVQIPRGVRVSELKSVWHSARGERVVLLGLGGTTMQVRNERLELQSELRSETDFQPLAVHDCLNLGVPQYLIFTGDGRLWLLSDTFEPLAILEDIKTPLIRGILPPDTAGASVRIALEADLGRVNLVLGFRKAPWHAVFTRHPILAFGAAFVPLSAVLAIIWTVMLRFRQKNRLIERQRDELARAMHDLREAQDKLIEAEKLALTNDIAGGVAHEIRNALDPAVHCLHALSERLAASGDDSDNFRLIELSEKSIRRAVSMTRLVREFADLAKVGTFEPVSAKRLLDEIIARHGERIDAIGATIENHLSEDVILSCPATHADILFNNLILNALDAVASAAERRIFVRGVVSEDLVRIHVADTGPGIPEAERKRIFHAFYSTKPSTGMGLGLTFSKRVAEILGGSLTLAPKGEGGAEFIVELPTTLSR
ncbi:MAG: ATP-binding protein, partial [Candidatus Zixiibacteriota bacterium]